MLSVCTSGPIVWVYKNVYMYILRAENLGVVFHMLYVST